MLRRVITQPHTPLATRSQRRLRMLSAVLLLHLALSFLASRPGAWNDRALTAAQPLSLPITWIALPPPPSPLPSQLSSQLPPPFPLARRDATAATQHRPSQPRPAPDSQTGAPAPTGQPAQAITLPGPSYSPAPLATAAASEPPRALNLSLPRGASAAWRGSNAAVEAARAAGKPGAGWPERLNAALGGDGAWHEERIDNDRVRFRRGNTCVDVERSRSGQLNPWNNSYSAQPWVAKPTEC